MHDWTLVDINYLWSEKQCLLRFKNSKSEVEEIKAIGAQLVEIPHKEEWGPSVSVNEFSIVNSENELAELRIEMQSGDVLIIRVDSYIGIP